MRLPAVFLLSRYKDVGMLRGSEGNHLSTGRTSLKGINVQTVQLRPRPNNAALSASQPPAEIQRNVVFEKDERYMDNGKTP